MNAIEIILGDFESHKEAQEATDELSKKGFNAKDLNVVVQDDGPFLAEIARVNLQDYTMADEDRTVYESSMQEGHVLVVVPAFEMEEETVENIMERHGAANVKTFEEIA